MNAALDPARTRQVILALGTLQGFALYALHRAIADGRWPATDLRWLAPLLLLALLLPLTAQMLAPRLRERAAWSILAAVGAALAYAGWHFGARVAESPVPLRTGGDAMAAASLALLVLWLIALPFLRVRLENGRWAPDYPALFRDAWRSQLTLAEAAVFTGVFWLLLFLWGQLFERLGIGFFAELFAMPLFVYPVTALVFGTALHLIGSVDRLVDVALGQILGLFKWLAPLAGFIVTAFTLALLPRLPALFGTGQRALDATLLLWLLALTVLLLNAAYQDGRQGSPYGRWPSLAMRAVPPLMLVLAVTALYALGVRVAEYGLTVSRYWGLVVAGAALAYSLAYAVAALRGGPWLGGIGQANVLVALALAATLAASLAPLASPWRLAAESQRARALAATDPARRDEALRHLRLELGGYGLAALHELRTLQQHPDAAAIRAAARSVLDAELPALRQASAAAAARPLTFDEWLDRSRRYPADAPLPEAAKALLRREFEAAGRASKATGEITATAQPALLVFLDLDGDGDPELLVAESATRRYRVYGSAGGGWQLQREGELGSAAR